MLIHFKSIKLIKLITDQVRLEVGVFEQEQVEFGFEDAFFDGESADVEADVGAPSAQLLFGFVAETADDSGIVRIGSSGDALVVGHTPVEIEHVLRRSLHLPAAQKSRSRSRSRFVMISTHTKHLHNLILVTSFSFIDVLKWIIGRAIFVNILVF